MTWEKHKRVQSVKSERKTFSVTKLEKTFASSG